MNWALFINSAVQGKAAYAQLINADRWSDNPAAHEVTDGFWSDNTFPYEYPVEVEANHVGGTMVHFEDGPSFSGQNFVSVNDTFKTFLIFKPTPQASSIWITLSELDWYWTASAQLDPWEVTMPTPTLAGPYTTDLFPQWTDFIENGSIVYDGVVVW